MKKEETKLFYESSQFIYYIEYHFNYGKGHLCIGERGIFQALKEDANSGSGKQIKCIKVFDPSKTKFMREKKDNIFLRCNHDTEVYQYLRGHYYFR